MKVIIKKVGRRHVLSKADHDWIKTNLNKPLSVCSITFDEESGDPWMIQVNVGNVHNDTVVLFVNENKVKYEFVGNLPTSN